jgi:branched-chain amino acid transport system substrate-binding protein
LLSVGILVASFGISNAQISDNVVRIGVLTDMEGGFSELSGKGSVLAAQMAAEDYGGTVAGKKIEIISADHQNKPDVASSLARSWYDQGGVDLIVDVPGSNIALAVQELARERKKMLIVDAVAANKFSGEACSDTGIMWLFNGYSNAKALGQGLVDNGATSWYFLTIDTEGGTGIQQPLQQFVEKAGGKVVGTSRFPLTTTDFSALLLKAQASGAKIIGIASSGANVQAIIKQGREFQTLAGGARFVVPFIYITEVNAIGLENGQGTLAVEPFYWALNDDSKRWSRRYFDKMKKMPTSSQAGVYTSILHYLKAVEKIGADDGPKVAAAMRDLPINDFMTSNGRVRIDGDVDRERYIFEVKKPSESTEPWDYYKTISKLGPTATTRPLNETGCPLVK